MTMPTILKALYNTECRFYVCMNSEQSSSEESQKGLTLYYGTMLFQSTWEGGEITALTKGEIIWVSRTLAEQCWCWCMVNGYWNWGFTSLTLLTGLSDNKNTISSISRKKEESKV